MIVKESPDLQINANIITAIAGKKGFSIIYLAKDEMNSEVGFVRKILSVLEGRGVNFEHLPSGIDTLSLVINSEDYSDDLLAEINRVSAADKIRAEHDVALIAVVGRGMKQTKGVAAKLFGALYRDNVNVRIIDQGSSELNIIVGVDNKDFDNAVKAIYTAFYG
jgi:aspartate kinase